VGPSYVPINAAFNNCGETRTLGAASHEGFCYAAGLLKSFRHSSQCGAPYTGMERPPTQDNFGKLSSVRVLPQHKKKSSGVHNFAIAIGKPTWPKFRPSLPRGLVMR
jgi:hypothetical protein